MRRWIWAAAAVACLLLSGCAALLERSYSVVELYADRYWDSGEEDTLNVENYQDLVNSLVMLIEQRTEEAAIRCYGDVGAYQEVARARSEVRWDTMEGAYLLHSIQFSFEEGAGYSTATFRMTYREDAEDLSSVMTLTDSQSLVDLLRLAVREEHEKITAQFTFDAPRETVRAAVESYWQELCRDEMEEASAPLEGAEDAGPDANGAEETDGGEADGGEGNGDGEDSGEADGDPAAVSGQEAPEAPPDGEPAEPVSGPPEEELIEYPPCPWVIRFYPNQDTAELVEILL